VVGVDTYHDSAKKGRSVGAFVASMNQTLTRYYSNCGFQSSHEELQNNLCTFMLGESFTDTVDSDTGKVLEFKVEIFKALKKVLKMTK